MPGDIVVTDTGVFKVANRGFDFTSNKLLKPSIQVNVERMGANG